MFTWSILSLNLVYFLYFFILLSCLCVISSNNPIYSILYLVVVFILTSFLFILYDLHFLGLMLMIVYLGAVIVLFLFIVMLLNIKVLELRRSINYYPFFFFFYHYFCFFFINNENKFSGSFFEILKNQLFFQIIFNFSLNDWSQIFFNKGSFFSIGNLLYTFFFIQFFLAGLILFVAMVGSIVLTLSQLRIYKKQVSYKQLLRNHFTISIFKI